MDRAMQLGHLKEAERHVAEGQRLIAEQEARVAELARDGHPNAARELGLLATMRVTQALHVGDRDRILKEVQQNQSLPDWLLNRNQPGG